MSHSAEGATYVSYEKADAAPRAGAAATAPPPVDGYRRRVILATVIAVVLLAISGVIGAIAVSQSSSGAQSGALSGAPAKGQAAVAPQMVKAVHLPNGKPPVVKPHVERANVGSSGGRGQKARPLTGDAPLRQQVQAIARPLSLSSAITACIPALRGSRQQSLAPAAMDVLSEAVSLAAVGGLDPLDGSRGGSSKRQAIAGSVLDGTLVAFQRCPSCQLVLPTHHEPTPFVALRLPIPAVDGDAPLTFKDCLGSYLGESEGGARQTSFCSGCNRTRPVIRGLGIGREPDVLTVVLGRRSGSNSQSWVDNRIVLPMTYRLDEYLYGGADLERPRGPAKYQLSGLIAKHGPISDGQYIAYVRRHPDSGTFELHSEGSRSESISNMQHTLQYEPAIQRNAYVLFYTRTR